MQHISEEYKQQITVQPPLVKKWGWYHNKEQSRIFYVLDIQHDNTGQWTDVVFQEVGKLEPASYNYSTFATMIDAGHLVPFRMTVAQYIFLTSKTTPNA